MSVAALASPNQRAKRRASWLSICLAGGSECANCLAASLIVVLVSFTTNPILWMVARQCQTLGHQKPLYNRGMASNFSLTARDLVPALSDEPISQLLAYRDLLAASAAEFNLVSASVRDPEAIERRH